jgi:hypothetical protein
MTQKEIHEQFDKEMERHRQALVQIRKLSETATADQVEVTEQHIDCIVVDPTDENKQNDILIGTAHYGDEFASNWEWETIGDYANELVFPEEYPLPITYQWHGGRDYPVPANKQVLVQFRNNSFAGGFVNEFVWEHSSDEVDIVGYTVLDIRAVPLDTHGEMQP